MGMIIEYLLFFIFGDGKNGKLVFLNIFSGIFGDYFEIVLMVIFMVKWGISYLIDFVMLMGVRFVMLLEMDEGKVWDEVWLK